MVYDGFRRRMARPILKWASSMIREEIQPAARHLFRRLPEGLVRYFPAFPELFHRMSEEKLFSATLVKRYWQSSSDEVMDLINHLLEMDSSAVSVWFYEAPPEKVSTLVARLESWPEVRRQEWVKNWLYLTLPSGREKQAQMWKWLREE